MGATQTSVTIANGESLSGPINLDSHRLAGIVLPAAWTDADISFVGYVTKTDGTRDTTAYPIWYTDGLAATTLGEVTINNNTGVSKAYKLDPTWFEGFRWVAIRSGTTVSAVNQGAARTLIALLTDRAG